MNNTSSVNTSVLISLLVLTLAFIVSVGSVNPAYAGNSIFQHKPASEDGSAKLVKGVVKTIFIVAAIQGGKKHLQKYLVRKAANDPRFKQGLIKQIKGYIKNNPKYKKKALALLAAIIGASAANELADDGKLLNELEDRQYRTFLANGGDASVEDWRVLGKPDALAQVASISRFNRYKDKFKAKVNSTAKGLKAKINKRSKAKGIVEDVRPSVAPRSKPARLKIQSRLDIDGAFSTTSPDDPRAISRFFMRDKGVLEVQDVFVTSKGTGADFLADSTKRFGVEAESIKTLKFKNVINEETVKELAEGVPVSDTKMARFGKNVLEKLGLKPKKVTIERSPRQVGPNILIEIE